MTCNVEVEGNLLPPFSNSLPTTATDRTHPVLVPKTNSLATTSCTFFRPASFWGQGAPCQRVETSSVQ